jgi:hypothetical protein
MRPTDGTALAGRDNKMGWLDLFLITRHEASSQPAGQPRIQVLYFPDAPHIYLSAGCLAALRLAGYTNTHADPLCYSIFYFTTHELDQNKKGII